MSNDVGDNFLPPKEAGGRVAFLGGMRGGVSAHVEEVDDDDEDVCRACGGTMGRGPFVAAEPGLKGGGTGMGSSPEDRLPCLMNRNDDPDDERAEDCLEWPKGECVPLGATDELQDDEDRALEAARGRGDADESRHRGDRRNSRGNGAVAMAHGVNCRHSFFSRRTTLTSGTTRGGRAAVGATTAYPSGLARLTRIPDEERRGERSALAKSPSFAAADAHCPKGEVAHPVEEGGEGAGGLLGMDARLAVLPGVDAAAEAREDRSRQKQVLSSSALPLRAPGAGRPALLPPKFGSGRSQEVLHGGAGG